MKNHILSVLVILSALSLHSYGQSGFPYQAVLRDNAGAVVGNQDIDVHFSIYQGADETLVYEEEHNTTTNEAGQFSLVIGTGKALSGDFQAIDWSDAPSFIQVEAGYDGSLSLIGRQELVSVPYAQYADHSGSLQTTSGEKDYRLIVDDLGNLQVIEFPEGYSKLVFHDEFNGTGLPDKSKWGYEEGFVRNHEMQYYTVERVENVFQEDGVLHIRCIDADTLRDENGEILNKHIEEDTGKDYYITSGSITTKNKYDWTYCRVEARLKVPQSSGTWPALWMMPSESVYGYWPRSGEIDIMEYIGNDIDRFYCATHFYNGDKGNNRQVDDINDWHIIAFEWHEDRMEFFCDGRMFYRILNPNTNWGDWPFDQPFYLILNFAFGGGWGGQKGFDNTALPLDYLVDYVRVFQE